MFSKSLPGAFLSILFHFAANDPPRTPLALPLSHSPACTLHSLHSLRSLTLAWPCFRLHRLWLVTPAPAPNTSPNPAIYSPPPRCRHPIHGKVKWKVKCHDRTDENDECRLPSTSTSTSRFLLLPCLRLQRCCCRPCFWPLHPVFSGCLWTLFMATFQFSFLHLFWKQFPGCVNQLTLKQLH